MIKNLRNAKSLLMNEKGSGGLEILAVIAMIIVVAFMGAGLLVEKMPYEKVATIEITALKDSPTMSGEFFLGSGTISGEMSYFYTVKTEDGGIKTEHITAEETTIYEVDKGPYHIDVYEASLFGMARDYNYKVYIPEGSITQEFNLNLE